MLVSGEVYAEAGGVFLYNLALVNSDAGRDISFPGTQLVSFLEGDLDMNINM